MRRKQLNIHTSHCTRLLQLAALTILLAGCFPRPSMAQQMGQKTFSSPEEASNALFTALQSNNEEELLDIFGHDNKQIVRSGDDTEDALSRANFVEKYKEMHRRAKEPDGTTTLIIGARNWPTPIPLVNKNNSWFFDTEAGSKEILFRRIGRNEISAIRVCQELVTAEKEYRASLHDEYARRIFSDEGQHNGLYWKVANGEPQSKWQADTITAVHCDQVADADPSITSCEVSLKVGNTVYVAVYKPPFGIDNVPFATGRDVEVLIGENTIMFNDLLGNSFQVPILRLTIVPVQGGQ
jgi:hypothetical protein